MDYKKKYKLIKYLFPVLIHDISYYKLQIDVDSLSYISSSEQADKTSILILKHIGTTILSDIVITDGTAGVGGNTLSFSKYFKMVNSIEIDKTRYNFLCNNIKTYNYNNILTACGDYVEIYKIFEQDVIFLDPPWGGKDYKKYNNLKLTISNISLEEFCISLFKYTKYIVLKLPKNYDIENMKKTIPKQIACYDLYNMFIVIINV